MRFKIVISAFVLAGCATFSNMEAGLNALMGRPDRQAFEVLGYPTTKQEFGGDTVYTWSVSRSGAIVTPQTATTTGYVGNKPVYGTTTYSQVTPVNYSCTIKIAAGPDGSLKNWEYDGNPGGCGALSDRLKNYAKSQGKL